MSENDDCDLPPYPRWAISDTIQGAVFTVSMIWVLCRTGKWVQLEVKYIIYIYGILMITRPTLAFWLNISMWKPQIINAIVWFNNAPLYFVF